MERREFISLHREIAASIVTLMTVLQASLSADHVHHYHPQLMLQKIIYIIILCYLYQEGQAVA
jgi:hypothetical protein